MRTLQMTTLFFSITLLVACSSDHDDLVQWIAHTDKQPQKAIKALPKMSTYQTFTYNAQNQRSPFEYDIQIQKNNVVKGSLLRPNTQRTPELLEKYPLDSLSMMGTLSKNNHLWALIKTPDKKIHRISLGQYLGQNFGQVTQIENTQIKLIELIPNGVNSWKQRQTSIAIKRPTNLQSTL
jgi:type IV pilus assembly protein PilP